MHRIHMTGVRVQIAFSHLVCVHIISPNIMTAQSVAKCSTISGKTHGKYPYFHVTSESSHNSTHQEIYFIDLSSISFFISTSSITNNDITAQSPQRSISYQPSESLRSVVCQFDLILRRLIPPSDVKVRHRLFSQLEVIFSFHHLSGPYPIFISYHPPKSPPSSVVCHCSVPRFDSKAPHPTLRCECQALGFL